MLPAAAAAAGTAAGKITPMLFDFLAKNHKLRGQLKFELVSIRDEFAMISSLIAEDDENRHQRQRSDGDQVHDTWIEMVRQLAHDIDDCIDRFTHRVMLQPGASWIRRKLHRVMTVKARGEFASAVRRLRTRSQDVYDKRKWYTQEPRPNDTTTRSGGSYEEETSEPVGMEAAQEELMELVRETNWTHGQQLKVISLVGFGGIGKTRLAMQLYDHNSNSDLGECQYEARAWAHAGEKGAENVLEDILMQLAAIASGGSLRKLCASLRQWLGTKRFFIVIDDMQVEFWDDIKDAFPSVPGISSRIIVTTNTQSIATKCSIDGHVYIMTTLDDEHSRQLFFKKASLVYPPQPGDKEMGSQVIKKCDGLPLALVTTARVLRGDPTQKDWTDLGENLGEELEKNKNLASMKHVLVRSYTTLGSKEMKTCLLYLGIYPSGRPIRRGSLVRKWLAEGFIKDDLTTKRNSLGVATLNFDTLVDRSIIQPIIDVNSTNITKVKTCRTHGMMREFILRESMSENFVTVLYDENPPQRSNIRWLSLQHQNAARARMKPEDLRLVRSLTIFGEAHNSVLDFSKYKQLKVLDLEECTFHMGDQHLKDICSNLVLLRYLSLGAAVTATVLPNKIKKLKLLETLDVRRTKIEILPTQVLKLPCLVHLFGKLKLQEDVGEREMHKIQAWLKENSKLERVAGFVVDKSKKMPQLIEHMDHLTKVKIWYKSTADDSSNSSHLSKSIKEFIQRGTDLNKTRSLSLNINGEWPEDMLNISLEMDYSYYLSSLKIEGNTICRQLPPFVTMLGSLTKLCLSFPGHKLRGDVLDVVLSNVRGLEYLKLIATELDKLVIRQDQLRILRSLCIVVHVMTGLVIEDRALLRLHSLQLLCKDLNGFSSTTIQSLPLLKEVALHDELSDQAEQDWKEEAKKHPRRPKVLCKLKGSKPAARTSTPATSTGALARVVAIESGPVENSESLGAPPTNMTLPQTTEQLRAILFQFVTSEMGSEPAAEITPAAIATDMMTQEVAVESEPVENSESPVAPPTDMRLPVTMPPKAISNGESVQVDGDGQHDDHETEDVYNTRGPNYFASENGPSTLMASVQKEMEGVAV